MNNNAITIQSNNPSYPVRVIAPIDGATLTCIGNVELLDMRGIGICGSRNASEDALKYAYRFGSEAATRNLVIVSGYARGVDREAHKGVLESGGCTIAVLPEGIDYFRLNRELKPYARMGENFLAVSMFPNNARWQSWRAMERNKLIVGLSSGMLVVEARDKGGTVNAGWECIRQGKKLWVANYLNDSSESAGNRLLLQNSAMPLDLNRIEDVKQALDTVAQHIEEGATQLAMGLG